MKALVDPRQAAAPTPTSDLEGRPDQLTGWLSDGTRTLLRRVGPGDKWRLHNLFDELSPRSRYLRFHSPVRRMTDQQLRYFTEIDQRDHVAWVATVPGPVERAIGVGRSIRLADQPSCAEVALTVTDQRHGHGLGTLLLALLAGDAAMSALRSFRFYVLSENRAMLALARDLGARQASEGYGVYRVELDLDPQLLSRLRDRLAARDLRLTARHGLPTRATA